MKKLALLLLLSLSTLTAYAQSAPLKCSGLDQLTGRACDLFYYDGETIVMIGGGTENKKYLIMISSNTVTIETKAISTGTYKNVKCKM